MKPQSIVPGSVPTPPIKVNFKIPAVAYKIVYPHRIPAIFFRYSHTHNFPTYYKNIINRLLIVPYSLLNQSVSLHRNHSI